MNHRVFREEIANKKRLMLFFFVVVQVTFHLSNTPTYNAAEECIRRRRHSNTMKSGIEKNLGRLINFQHAILKI